MHFFLSCIHWLLLSFSVIFALPAFAQNTSDNVETNVNLAVFSTYPSAKLNQACVNVTTDLLTCTEDSISAEAFVSVLSQKSWFSDVIPFNEGPDYELLIANTATTAVNSAENKEYHFTEFTVQWRGIEIDSTIIPTTNDLTLTNDEKARLALTEWYVYALKHELFSAQFLYTALDASDYQNQLQVPETLGEFTRLDTQLYPDPFKGAITRYVHPSYEDALVDVSVYPILAPLEKNTDTILHQQLDADWTKAGEVATARNLTLTQPVPVSPFVVNNHDTGWVLGLKAESSTDTAIFATTYVFKRNDKIIKVATTFPSDFSNPLASELISQISVPDESPLMQQIRSMLE